MHRHPGPGLLENIYQRCLRYELAGSNVAFEAGKAIDVAYKGETLNCGVRLDFLVEELENQ